jgi:hypothetical protein
VCPPPPRAPQDPSHAIYIKIIQNSLSLPASMAPDAKRLLKALLAADIGDRMTEAADIKAHPWFRDVDWLAVFQVRVCVCCAVRACVVLFVCALVRVWVVLPVLAVCGLSCLDYVWCVLAVCGLCWGGGARDAFSRVCTTA